MIRFASKYLFIISRSPVSSSWKLAPGTSAVLGHHASFCTESPSTGGTEQTPAAKIADLGILLSSAEKKNLHTTTACEIVIAIASLKKESKVSASDFLQDERFLKIMKLLEGNNTSKVDTMAIISSLKALEELGINKESFSVKNLENSLTWNSRSCPIKELMMMLSFTIKRKNTENQKLLFNEVCKSLERRWVEIKDGKLFASLLHYSELFSPQFVAKLEDRIADLMEEISPGDLSLILAEMGKKKRRNIPLLKSLTFYLTKHRNMLDIKQISDCLFALKQLSYKDQDTLERLCAQLEGLVKDTASSPVLRSVLISLGQLKYLHTPVVDRIMDWHQARLDNSIPMTTKDMTTLLMTCATLNHNPVQHSSLLEHMSQSLSLDLPEQVWLDTVWSLTVLGRATHHHLQSVLTPAFHTSLLYHTTSTSTQATLKLLNINAAAKLLYPDYQGPTMKVVEDALLKDIKISPSLAKVQFTQSVMEAFTSLFPPPRLLRTNVNTMLGCVAEGEFICDSLGRPLQVQELSNNFASYESEKPLPPNAHRMALVTASFQDYLIGGEVSGLTAFNIKLMEAAGYKVFLVKYSEWQQTRDAGWKAKADAGGEE